MKFTLEYTIGDKIMIDGRQQVYINGVSGLLDAKGNITDLLYSSNEVSRIRTEDIKKVISKSYNREIEFKPNHNIGDELIYLDNNPYKNNYLKKDIVKAISFSIINSNGNGVYWYKFSKFTIDRYNVFISIIDFVNKTAPKKLLSNDKERFIYTKYMIQVNKLKVVEMVKETTTHAFDNRGNKYRKCDLFTSVTNFNNRMFSQLK